MEFYSAAKPSLFAYPPAVEEKKERTSEKVETAVLSITAKAKRKERLRTGGVGSASAGSTSERMEVVSG